MKMYSTGEAAKQVGVTRDSLFAALKGGAPDAANRVGNRRIFTQEEVDRLAAWFDYRWKVRDGKIRRGENADAISSAPQAEGKEEKRYGRC